MRLWILKDSEQLPLIEGAKQMRAGMLAEIAQSRGHQVEWWCSTTNHMKKALYAEHDQTVTLPSGVLLRMLHAGFYTRNLSVARLLHHRRLAKRWRSMAEAVEQTPDLILVAYPIIEWVREALVYAKPRNIPVVVDVRDLWPDTFSHYAPPPLKPFVKLATYLLYPYAGRVLRQATAVTSMSKNVLHWALTKATRPVSENCRVFYIGTNLSDLTFERHTMPSSGETVHVCFLGTLGHTADLLTIAHAAKILADSKDPINITIAGDGDMMKPLCDYLQTHPGIYTLPGWLDKNSGLALLEKSDIALLTGNAEAMPNKFFDYVAAGLPIVCSLRGEAREYIEQHQLGRTCPAGDAAALAEAIRTVAKNLPAYKATVANVPKEHYSKQAIYTAFAEFLESQEKR